MSEKSESKQKELLPDILAHQERMDKRRALLSETISVFENEWRHPDPHKLREGEPDHEKKTTVDSIYAGMSRLEDEFDDLSTRLMQIKRQYLGEK